MRMQIFRVKKPSCKILKTKTCVPFEVQYISRAFSLDNFLLLFCKYVRYILKICMKKFDDELIFHLFLLHFNLVNHIESWPIVHTL